MNETGSGSNCLAAGAAVVAVLTAWDAKGEAHVVTIEAGLHRGVVSGVQGGGAIDLRGRGGLHRVDQVFEAGDLAAHLRRRVRCTLGGNVGIEEHDGGFLGAGFVLDHGA